MNQNLKLFLNNCRKNQEKITLVTGVFDLIHIEHLRFFHKAKHLGERLLVGLESDARVKRIKGPKRPFNSEQIRLEQLTYFKAVDFAFILPEEFSTQESWENLISSIKPDYYAVSSNTSFLENKQIICQKFSVNFSIIHEHNPDYSTSKIFSQLNIV